MFRAFWKLAQFRNCIAQIGSCQIACQFRNCVRNFETAQQELLRKLEMAVYTALKLWLQAANTPLNLLYYKHVKNVNTLRRSCPASTQPRSFRKSIVEHCKLILY